MSGEERLKQIDPGTGLTLEELIDAFITDPREAKRLKVYLSRNKAEEDLTDDRTGQGAAGAPEGDPDAEG